MNKKRKEATQKKKNEKQSVKLSRLQNFLDKDLCACGPENMYLCKGICRQAHKNSSGIVVCGEKYQTTKYDIVPRNRNKNRKSSDSVETVKGFDKKRKKRKE